MNCVSEVRVNKCMGMRRRKEEYGDKMVCISRKTMRLTHEKKESVNSV